jgi:hypothetical protein
MSVKITKISQSSFPATFFPFRENRKCKELNELKLFWIKNNEAQISKSTLHTKEDQNYKTNKNKLACK